MYDRNGVAILLFGYGAGSAGCGDLSDGILMAMLALDDCVNFCEVMILLFPPGQFIQMIYPSSALILYVKSFSFDINTSIRLHYYSIRT